MFTAYSILLGEHVDAKEVVHADTAGFQIVCPCCRESVLKVERQGVGGFASHFFSHRQRSSEMAAECERRVASIPAEQRQASDAVARGQNLAVFQASLRGALALQDPHFRGLKAKRHHARYVGHGIEITPEQDIIDAVRQAPVPAIPVSTLAKASSDLLAECEEEVMAGDAAPAAVTLVGRLGFLYATLKLDIDSRPFSRIGRWLLDARTMGHLVATQDLFHNLRAGLKETHMAAVPY